MCNACAKFGNWSAVTLLTVLLAITGSSYAEPSPSDALKNAVQERLDSRPSLQGSEIKVDVIEDRVTLNGHVSSILERERAAEAVKEVPGVQAVENNLLVKRADMSDSEIASQIEHQLKSDEVASAYKLKTSVDDGTVTIKGKVDSWQDAREINQLIAAVPGVRKVQSQIDYDIDKRTDREILSAINSRLAWHPLIHRKELQIGVSNGEVKISGTARTLAEKDRIFDYSWVAGVKSVDTSAITLDANKKIAGENPEATMSDEQIVVALKNSFSLDSRLKHSEIAIVAENGVVTLDGSVLSEKAQKRAGEIAAELNGVKEVHNKLTVNSAVKEKGGSLQDYLTPTIN